MGSPPSNLPSSRPSTSALLTILRLVLILRAAQTASSAPCPIGVNYAGPTATTNPLDARTAVKFIRDMGASYIKLYAPDPEIFKAMAGTNMSVVVGVLPHEKMNDFAASDKAALDWINANIVPYKDNVTFTKIAVANEVIDPGNDPVTMKNVVPGMWALYRALRTLGLQDKIKVVSPQHPGFVPNPEPPSNATVREEVKDAFVALLDFISRTGSHLYITNMPFYAYKDYPQFVSRGFAMFKGFDGYYDKDGRYYQNSFDQNLDAILSVAEKLGFPDVPVEIAETGWPTAGATVASVRDAQDFLEGVLGKVCSGQGTPRRPGLVIPTVLFEAFDQDQKIVPTMPWESHWGLSDIFGRPKFPLDLRNANLYPAPPTKPPLKWCVARPGADPKTLQGSVSWVCSQGVDCAKINSSCPEDLRSSAIFNNYYQEISGQKDNTCNFTNTAQVVLVDPSQGGSCAIPGKPSFAGDVTAQDVRGSPGGIISDRKTPHSRIAAANGWGHGWLRATGARLQSWNQRAALSRARLGRKAYLH